MSLGMKKLMVYIATKEQSKIAMLFFKKSSSKMSSRLKN